MSRNIEDLHPSFGPIVAEVLRRAPERGIYPFVTQGRRLPEYQACLYAQGRLGIGKTMAIGGFSVTAALSADGKSVIVSAGKASNVVPLKRWAGKVTQVGPFGSWHVFGLAVDFSFRSAANSRDDLVHDLEEAIAIARKGGDAKRAAAMYGVIDSKYRALAAVWDEVAAPAIWGNDWDDDGVLNGPDPDNEWTDIPHFEWHPGIGSISSLTSEARQAILAGTTPAAAKQCARCKAFSAVAINDLCRKCHELAARTVAK